MFQRLTDLIQSRDARLVYGDYERFTFYKYIFSVL